MRRRFLRGRYFKVRFAGICYLFSFSKRVLPDAMRRFVMPIQCGFEGSPDLRVTLRAAVAIIVISSVGLLMCKKVEQVIVNILYIIVV